MDPTDLRRRLADSSVAVLATITDDGKPHLVPICFALDGDVIYFAVDQKPKRTRDLKRLHNIAANPSVAVLVQHYEHDWRRLWWVRVDGTARVLEAGDRSTRAVEVLIDRYPQYRERPPEGPVVEIAVARITGWAP
jgi:PPOX class probable F420-dependent enzyme